MKIVDTYRHGHDVVDFLRTGPAERCDVFFCDQRVAKLIVLVAEFNDGPRQGGSFLDAQPLGHRAGGNIANNDLQWNDLDLTHQLFAHVEPFDEMSRQAEIVQALEYELRYPVVEHALAFDNSLLFGIERGGVVLEMND